MRLRGTRKRKYLLIHFFFSSTFVAKGSGELERDQRLTNVPSLRHENAQEEEKQGHARADPSVHDIRS